MMQQARDILPVAPDHQRGDQHGQRRVEEAAAAEEKCGDGHGGGGADGAERDVSRQQPQGGEQTPRDQTYAPIQQPHQRTAGQDALAAFEAEEHREHMTQLTAKAAQQDAQHPVAGQIVEGCTANQAGDHCFTHVEEDDAQCVFGTVGAVEVGQARIAAAVLPHIVLDDEVADHYRAVETT